MWDSSDLNNVSEGDKWQENKELEIKLEELLNSLWENSESKQVEDLFKEIREKIGEIRKMDDNTNRADKKNLKDLFDIIENNFLEIKKIVDEDNKSIKRLKEKYFLIKVNIDSNTPIFWF